MSVNIQFFDKEEQFKKDFPNFVKEEIPPHLDDFIKKLQEKGYTYAILVGFDYMNAFMTDEGNIECYNENHKSQIFAYGKYKFLLKDHYQGDTLDEDSTFIKNLKDRINDEAEVVDMKDIFVDIYDY